MSSRTIKLGVMEERKIKEKVLKRNSKLETEEPINVQEETIDLWGRRGKGAQKKRSRDCKRLVKELPFEGDGLKGRRFQQESLVKACWGGDPILKGFCLLFLEKLPVLKCP